MNAIPIDDITAELNGTKDDWTTLLVWADALDDIGDERAEGLRDVVASGRFVAFSQVMQRASWGNFDFIENAPERTSLLPNSVTRFTSHGYGFSYCNESCLYTAYLDAAQAYVAKRQYKRHLARIRRHKSKHKIFAAMVELAEWLDGRGMKEAVGWRWLVKNKRIPGYSHFWYDPDPRRYYWNRCGGNSIDLYSSYIPDSLFYSVVHPGNESDYLEYPSRLHAFIDAARAYAR